MPRKISKVEACMFCGEMPCVCAGPAKSKRSTKKSSNPTKKTDKPVQHSPSVDEELPAKSDVRSAMKKMADWKPKPMEDTPDISTIGPPDRDYEMERAIRVLEPILHPTEQRRFQEILRPTDVKDRAAAWRDRRG